MVVGEVLRLQLRRTFFHLDAMWRAEAFSYDQENGRDPLDKIFYEHGVKMGTLTATKKGPVTFPARTLGVD